MREKYNPENIFEKNNTEEFTDSINEINENLPDVAEYKHSIFKKIWRKLKRLFTRKKDDANE